MGAVAILAATLALAVTGSTPASADPGVVTGTVFRDFNSDGFMNTSASVALPAVDVGMGGVTVRAFDSTGAQVATATTAANGTYTLNYTTGDATTDVRIEFDDPVGYESGPRGSGSGVRSGTSVQFRTTGQTANYGVHQAGGEFSLANPVVVIPVARGLSRAGGISALVPGTAGTLYATNYSTTGTPAIGTGANDLRLQATRAQTGTIWGTAPYGADRVFSAAFFKRHTPIGPGGIGAIYLTDIDTGTANAANWVTIPNAGSNPRGSGETDPTYDWFHDIAAYPAVYKVGLGDLDMSVDRRTLYAVNLNDRNLYAVPVTPAANVADPPVAGTPASIAMPLDLPGATTGCNQADVRPFGLHTDALGVWATLTCTGPAVGNLRGYVYRYDETTGAWDSQPAVEFSLGGNRGKAWTGAFGANNANWRAWADNFAAGVSGSSYSDAQPLLSDLEFDSNGDMSIGIKDRTGDRVGMDAGNLTSGNTSTYEGFNAGDLLRACVSGSTWVVENNGSCGSRTGYGVGNNQGPGGGEFYHDDYPTTGSSSHQQSMLGTAEQVPGFTNLVATSYDPLSNVRVSGFRNVSNTNGANVSGVEVTGDGRGNQTTCLKCQGTFGKADGMGDIEALLEDSPIQIGNRVWQDDDRDGVQDAGEDPIEGVTVNLYSGTTVVGTTTTDPFGEYYFSDANVTGGLLQETDYRIALDLAADYATGPLVDRRLTTADAGDDDDIDSDGTLDGDDRAEHSITTGGPGADDHTFDFGFTLRFDLALRKQLAPTQTTPVEPGDPVTFRLTVFNQGADQASEITLHDELPEGTMLDDPDWTDNGDGTASLTIAGPLDPGDSTSVDITLLVDRPAPDGTITNTAEISAALDGGGNEAVDDDSTPDLDLSDDPLVDDEIDDDGTTDEDDHDIATVDLETPGFDLALRKQLAVGQGSEVAAGDDVTFTITVFNQGDAPATDVVVTDYLPPSMALNDPDWADNGDGTAQVTLPGTLDPGESIAVDLTLTLDADAETGDFDNYAEISSANDRFGGDGNDIDSTPDTDVDDDALIDDEITETPQTGDEDDHDVARVSYNTFDLALRKTTTASQVRVGDLVPFTITVFNQGSLEANDIVVTDHLPAELAFNPGDNPGWTLVGGNPTIEVTGPLASGDSVDLTLNLEVIANAEQIDNYAEISAARGPGGLVVDDLDSTPDLDLGDRLVDNEIDDDGTTDEDDHDIASIGAPAFDLALRKTTGSDLVVPGELVSFDITVFNQGEQEATGIVITDEIPAGMTFDAGDNAGWSLVGGNPTITIDGPLLPGDDATVTIALRVADEAVGGTFTNTAEISAATDESGLAAIDRDSVADTDLTDDVLVDDEIDNAGGDEDDHDVAAVRVEPFDLALRKVLADGQASTVEPGDSASFDITVFNQGDVTATDITITDTLPAGTTLDDAAWTDNGDGTASRTINGPLEPGDAATLRITLVIDRPATDGTFTNTAEISAAFDGEGIDRTDEDSTPDTDPDDDTLVDDEIDNAAGDEDDHDIAEVEVVTPVFDLALRKTLAVGQPSTVRGGQQATFLIEVFNQGEMPAQDIVVTDTLPAGTTLDDPSWSDNGDGTASRSIAGPLAVGDSTAIDITVLLDADHAPGPITNTAEISAADDRWGEPGNDTDSSPDADASDDELVDDVIDNAGGDEDDHDIAELTVPVFDLALRKTVADGIVGPGDAVEFEIELFNQGDIPAIDIEVLDHVGDGFTYDAADNPTWTMGANGATTTIAGPLDPGDSTSVTITLRVSATSAVERLFNRAEIIGSTDELGVVRTDIDSTPDTDGANDPTVDDEIDDDGTTDEDDHDLASVRLFDLALRKTTTASAVQIGDEVDFAITVFNQGLVPAGGYTITDYLPAEMTFDPADNPGWTEVDGNPTLEVTEELAPGDIAQFTLTLTVSKNRTSIDNFAEISGAEGPSGEAVTDVDSTPNTENADPMVDNEIDNGGNDEDDHDIASVVAKPLDLALRKTTTADAVAPGDLVPFTIRVFNQGEQAAHDIVVTDAIPAGMTFDAADNPGWALVAGQPTAIIGDPIAPGGNTTVTIQLRVASTATAGNLTNTAEITGATGEDGRPGVDIDSVPDADLAGDVLVDDVIDNADGDEDDHDIAAVRVLPFDLAVRKVLSEGQADTVEPGDPVDYTITVFNQGDVTATDVVLTDTIPAGTTLADSGWTDNGDGTASRTVAGPIDPGDSTTVTITLLINRPAANGTVTNTVEITAALDGDGNPRVDEDSTPNPDPSDDPLVDDEIDDDGTTDEDDHDIAEVTLYTPPFDLALRKELGPDQAAQVRPGQDATFRITVFNQGQADATSVQLIDRLPAGTTLADGDWTDNGDGTASITLPGTLAAGDSTSVDLTLTIDAMTEPGDLLNRAEISAANDRFGGPGGDIDSTPDDDLADDPLVDDVIDNADGDEDDHDVAELTVPNFDLALRKTTAVDIAAPGQLVPFTITVLNQGAIPAANIEITDTLPAGFAFDGADNPGWALVGGHPTTTIDGPLAAGANTAVTINLTVVPSSAAGAYDNLAEISAATDDLGVGRPDVDSTPDADASDDVLVDDVIDNAGGDEDDHDIASVRTFDLALRKTTSASQVQVGDLVPFEIEVFNQGNVTATGVEVIDFLPEELAFDGADNPAWTEVNGRPVTTIAGSIDPGDSVTVTVHLRVVANAARIDNLAEISAAAGPQGETVVDLDSTGNTDATDDVLVDNEIGNGSNDEDDHDIASIGSPPFDLALRKTLSAGQSATVWPGDDVSFSLEVFNQGEQAAADIVITDAIPTGMTFDPADNLGWSLVAGQPTTTIAGPLAPGTSVTRTIVLSVDAGLSPRMLQNRAEISAATDESDRPGLDLDSSPDTDLAGDTLVDDVIDNTGGDEDDHDVAEITVPRFDLALRKTLADGQASTVYVGDRVSYTITVFNQGSIAATDVTVADTIPSAMGFDPAENPGWALVGGKPTTTIDGPIDPDGSASVELVLTVVDNGTSLVNHAEITTASDGDGTVRPDIDSTPDADETNDELIDDVIDETPAGGDEDDHDIAEVSAPVFDLALRKTLGDDQAPVAYAGEDATFTITVFNQGSVTAADIQIADRLPEGLSFDDALNPAWANDGGVLTTTIGGPLAPGASAQVDLILGVTASVGDRVDNLAEIAGATDTTGRTPPDIDSTPDTDLSNDELVDDEIDSTPGGDPADEDDHDIAPLSTPTWDLALRKTLAPGQASVVDPGDLVEFRITVFNQGTVPASNIEVRDALPEGLAFDVDDNSGWSTADGVPVTTIDGPVAPGASASVDIVLRLSQSPPESLTNIAEITDSTDDVGRHPTDVDSLADEDEDNDSTVDDEVENLDGDEDDNDIAVVSADIVQTTTTTTNPTNPTTTVPGVDPTVPPDGSYPEGPGGGDPGGDGGGTDGTYDPTGSGADNLAQTGMDIARLVGIGMVLILAGVVMRRRWDGGWA